LLTNIGWTHDAYSLQMHQGTLGLAK
jgi:hypothetical protein